MYEASDSWGGHTRSDHIDGFTFDEGPHVSFTKDERVRDMFSRGAGDVLDIDASIANTYVGNWILHPAQCHLYGLDVELVARCLIDLERARSRSAQAQPSSYADWCRGAFGATFAETFPFAYTRKYWTIEASDMGTDWIGERVYAPSFEDVVRGALLPDNEGRFHYLSRVRYPAAGGFQAFLGAFAHPEHVMVGKRVVRIDPEDHRLQFEDGTEASYEHLISTMPLPALVDVIGKPGVPTEVRAATDALLCTSVVLVDIAVDRPDLGAHHWFYSYDDDVSFSRASFPHMLSSANAPTGCGSIQAEVYYSRHRALPCDASNLPERVISELCGVGVLRSPSEVLWARHRDVRYANVVFDLDRADAIRIVRPWVESQGITLAGRYGEWAYFWTDDAVRSGWAAAESIMSAAASSAH